MNMKKTTLNIALATFMGFTAIGAVQAATFNVGDVLTITDGVQDVDLYGNPTNVTTGSFFVMDLNADSKAQGTEKTPINGLAGITIGQVDGPGVIDDWFFSGATGQDYTSGTAVTGDTTNGLDMSGWTVFWNGGDIDMSGGAWTIANCGAAGCTGFTFASGVADIQWSGTYGDTYDLWYSATVPSGGFAGVQYALHLTGTVTQGVAPVPVPAAVWLFGSGPMGLVGVARRRKTGTA